MDKVALTAETEEPKPIEQPSDGIGSNVKEYSPLYDHFGIDNHNPKVDSALNKIWEYAKSISEGKDKESILFTVIKLSHRVATSSLSNSSYRNLLMYVTALENERKWSQTAESLVNGYR